MIPGLSLRYRPTAPQKGLETRRKYTVYSCTHSNVHTFLPYCILNTSFTHTVVSRICVLCACARVHWPDSRAAHLRSHRAHHVSTQQRVPNMGHLVVVDFDPVLTFQGIARTQLISRGEPLPRSLRNGGEIVPASRRADGASLVEFWVGGRDRSERDMQPRLQNSACAGS